MAVLFLGLRGHSWNDGRKTSPNIPYIHFPERIYCHSAAARRGEHHRMQ